MSYQINLGNWKSIFAVPSSVVDQHIKIASGDQIKVLLYLLRHADEEVDVNKLSDALCITAEEADNAVCFWIDRGLLTQNENMLSPAETAASTEAAAEKPAAAKEEPKKVHTTVSRPRRPDPAFVAKLLKEDLCLAGLLEEAQTTLKKPLSSGDTETLVMLYDSCGLPCEVIAMLLNYLASIGSADMRSLVRFGIRWSDAGIKTVDDAEQEIGRLESSRKAWGKVSALLGIRSVGRPTKAQMENADRWLNTWHFSDEMITEAYERCVNKKNEFSLSYTNAILKRWNEKNIRSLDTLQKEESAADNKPRSNSKVKKGKGSVYSLETASFDVQKYENDSLFDD